jgi:hypothetical protein
MSMCNENLFREGLCLLGAGLGESLRGLVWGLITVLACVWELH